MIYAPSAPSLGLTQKERSTYSVAGLIRAVVNQDRGEIKRYQELSSETAKLTGQTELTRGFLLPRDLLGEPQRRDLSAGGGGSKGGFLVETEVAGYSASINRASLVGTLPINRIDDLRGNVTIPGQVLQHQTVWAAEGASAEPTQGEFGSVSFTPKTAVSLVTLSKQLLFQLGDAGRRFIDRQLGVSVDEAIDTAIVQGVGGVQPLGVLNVPGIDTRTGNAFDMAAAAAMLKVAEAYASDDSVIWVAGIDAAATLRQRLRTATYGSGFMVEGNEMLGRPFIVSRSMPAARLICAPWSSVMLASWGAPELRIDASTYFEHAAVRVGVFSMVDVAVERAQAIAVATAVS